MEPERTYFTHTVDTHAFVAGSGEVGEHNDNLPAESNRDLALETFIETLLPPDEARKVLRGFYTDALHRTLHERLAVLRNASEPSYGRRLNPLPKWRLKRVYEFVDANLEERISLGALAQIAGISRMHFAAQFREATGLRPHDYVIGRRIHVAKDMLARSEQPIVDTALSVGFQTQAHFTTVFKRIEGLTPHRWRELNRAYSRLPQDEAPQVSL